MTDLQRLGSLIAWLLAAGSLAVWGRGCARWIAGDRSGFVAGREPIPWSPLAVGLAFPVWLCTQQAVLSLFSGTPLEGLNRVKVTCLASGLSLLTVPALLLLTGPRRRADFGLGAGVSPREVGWGLQGFLATWLPVIVVSLLVNWLGLREAGARHSFFDILEQHPGAATIGWILLAVVVLAPLAEELLYRVVLQGWLENRLPTSGAIVVVAVLFAAMHYVPGRPDSLPLFPLALGLGWLYHRRRSYLAVVCLHAAFNATNLALAVMMQGL
ncbi:MAG: lysostaphin resistance A-like protein [Planctomycetales bacterium]